MNKRASYQTVMDLDLAEMVRLSRDRVLVSVFTAEWLGAAHLLDTIIEDIADQYVDNFRFIRLNVDDMSSQVSTLGIKEIPTTLIMRDGEIVGKFTGVLSKHKIRGLLDQLAR